MSVKYFHSRIITPYGAIATHGGATVAFVDMTPDKPKDVAHQYHYANAYCREGENFNKKIGRDVAAGRLKAGKYIGVTCLPKDLYEQVF